MAEKRVIELEIQTNEKSLKAQLREAQAEVAALSEKFGATSQAAIQAAKRAAELKDTIGDAKNLTDAFNPDAKFNALSASIGGVLNGFQAFEGALGLVGVEGEAVQETMLKVQSAMALSQGIQGVFEAKDAFIQLGAVLKTTAIGQALLTAATAAYNFVVGASTTALKVFRIALISTGIGAIVVALGLLVANFDKVKNAIVAAYEWFDKLGPKIKVLSIGLLALVSGPLALFAGAIYGVVKALEYFGVIDDRETARMKANAKAKTDATEKELNKKIAAEKRKAQAVDENLSFEIRKAQAAGKNTEEMEEKKLQAALKSGRAILKMQKEKIAAYEAEIKMLKATGDADSERAKKLEKSLSETKKAANEQYKENKKNSDDLTILQITAEKERTDKAVAAAKERKDKIKQIRDSELEELKRFYFEAEQLLKDDFKRTIDDINRKYDEQVKLAKKYGKDTAILEQARQDEIAKATHENNSKNIITLKNLEIQKLQIKRDSNLQLKGAINEELEAERQAAEHKQKILEAQAVRAQKLEEQSQSFKVKTAQQGLELISNITELFGKKSEKAAKRAFQIQKAASIASALITTYQNATSAYASQFVPIPDPSSPVRGGIAAGIAIASGLVNVAKIASQKFESGTPAAGGGAPAGGGGGGMVQSPNFSVIGSSGVNQLAQLQQQPVQAYVVSGEVTSQQALDRNRLQNATL
jgi:hypothetical protein